MYIWYSVDDLDLSLIYETDASLELSTEDAKYQWYKYIYVYLIQKYENCSRLESTQTIYLTKYADWPWMRMIKKQKTQVPHFRAFLLGPSQISDYICDFVVQTKY